MENRDFATTLVVDQSPRQAFDAINNVRGWWSENVEGFTDQLNGVYYYHYQDIHRCTIKVTELVPGKRVAWQVLDNYFKFTADKSEWVGNEITFDISEKNGKTEIRFTQEGLVPHYECYQVCFDAWTHFIHDSLGSLIATGIGEPSPKDGGESFDSRMVEKLQLDREV